MSDVLDFLKFIVDFDLNNLSLKHTLFAAVATVVIYFIVFLVRKYGKKLDISLNFTDGIVKCGTAIIVEFILILIFGPRITVISIVIGIIVSVFVRTKFFSFIDNEKFASRDLSMRVELSELNKKFKKNPHYSILEVLLYYGYISSMQKELVEAKNIFKTPDEMAKEFLSKPILTEDQLEEAIGIMNVIRREGKILTREEALLLIVNLNSKVQVQDFGLLLHPKQEDNKEETKHEETKHEEPNSEVSD